MDFNSEFGLNDEVNVTIDSSRHIVNGIVVAVKFTDYDNVLYDIKLSDGITITDVSSALVDYKR